MLEFVFPKTLGQKGEDWGKWIRTWMALWAMNTKTHCTHSTFLAWKQVFSWKKKRQKWPENTRAFRIEDCSIHLLDKDTGHLYNKTLLLEAPTWKIFMLNYNRTWITYLEVVLQHGYKANTLGGKSFASGRHNKICRSFQCLVPCWHLIRNQ